jgi:CBS domain-containing protein
VLRSAARQARAKVVLTGILPTLSKTDLRMENMSPRPRYRALDEATCRLRGGPLHLHVEGADELHVEHDNVMLEACNTSFQMHLQVSAEEFAPFYNVAQTIAAPVLAAAVNSPLLFGRRLWKETRIALFRQSVDTRRASVHARELSPRVRFGERWIKTSVLEVFQEDVARFPVLMATPVTEDPMDLIEAGKAPELQALSLHNGTVYTWNRACYGLGDGQAHLRIECRLLPAGPSVVDEVANAAFWAGLILGVTKEYGDITTRLDFSDAKANFIAAGRLGLKAGFNWVDGQMVTAPDLILSQLLPLARAGLESVSVDPEDIDRYLGIIQARVETRRVGANWLLESLARMRGKGSPAERFAALTAATVARQETRAPGHEWPLARLDESGGWEEAYARVEQFMDTELFTVNEDELVERVAFVMDRKQLRHVLVEDRDHKLVGIVSYRLLIRLLADGEFSKEGTIAVKEIMSTDPITIPPDMPSTDAIELMRVKRVSALPVVAGGKLVGLVSERDFMGVAHELLMEKLRRTP